MRNLAGAIGRFALLVTVPMLLGAACKGADGAMGPAGPPGAQGPIGPAGPGTKVTLIVTIGSNGTAQAQLPAAAGSNINQPPSMSCYTTQAGATAWLQVADGFSSTSTYCGLGFSGGQFTALMLNGIPGWLAAFVVVY